MEETGELRHNSSGKHIREMYTPLKCTPLLYKRKTGMNCLHYKNISGHNIVEETGEPRQNSSGKHIHEMYTPFSPHHSVKLA